MGALVLRRVAQAILVLWVVTTATFVLIHAAPGGPAVLADPKLSAVERAAIERQLGLDQPLAAQYLRWHRNLLRGDLGRSFLYQTPTLDTVLARLPNTLVLVAAALVVSLLIAVPVGTAVGLRPGTRLDRTVSLVNFTSLAIPPFWFAIVAILLMAVRWRLLPAGGMMTPGEPPSAADRFRHLVLPALVLALPLSAELIRYLRNAVAAAAGAPHVVPARARGVPGPAIVGRHVTRNALLPVLTVLGLQVPLLVGGAAITETVFSWPGMGRLGVEAALGRDYPLVMGITLVVAVTVVVANLALDLAYGWVDPRIRETA
ncbi:MAG: ABC transporter permease [Gemmatimonadales bacterium]